MALRFVDSFDHYVTADILKKYSNKLLTPEISATQVRNGIAALKIASGNEFVDKDLGDQVTWVVGFAVYLDVLPITQPIYLAALMDSSTYQLGLALQTDGKLSFRRGGSTTAVGTAVTGGTSTLSLSLNTWHYVEFKVTIADSIGANTCQIEVNGAQWANVTTGQDLKQTTNASADIIRIGHSAESSPGGVPITYFDDLYICDGTGSKNNDFLGDVVVEALHPDGNGTTSDFLGSDANSVDNYLHVDEVAPDGDSTYVGSSTITERDLYTFDNLVSTPAANGIHGVISHTASSKTDAGTRTGKITLRTASTNYDGSEYFPSNGSYAYFSEIWELNPNTAGNWDSTAVDGLESGVYVQS